jgi:tetratricopeptide (TPR) repeat protein
MNPGRNDACPCGSGKKYKRCCGSQPSAPAAQSASRAAARTGLAPGLDPSELQAIATLVDRQQWDEVEHKSAALVAARPATGLAWKILSVAQLRQGKQAMPALRRAAQLLPDDAEAHANLGAILHSEGQLVEALASYYRALELSPNQNETLLQSADIQRALKRPREAIQLYRRALQLNSRHPQTHNNLANALMETDEIAAAAEHYKAALELNPRDAKVHSNLAAALIRLKQSAESLVMARRAVELDPQLPEAQNQLGLAFAAQGEFDQACACYRAALSLDQQHVEALSNLGNALRDLGDRGAAMAAYAQAVNLDPARADSHCNLGNMLFEFQRIADAAACYARALALNPDHKGAHLSLGLTLRMHGRTADAEASCRAALAIDPRYAEALTLLGELRTDQGQFSEAQTLFQRAIAVDPDFPSAFYNIAMHRKMTTDDRGWLSKTKSLAASPLPLRHVISLRYALGKYFDDVNHYDQAFENYQCANEMTKRGGPKYDDAALTSHVDSIIKDFDANTIRGGAANGNPSQLPVFIVGMPRSGTSLTEQILASHPEVFGAGELRYWDDALQTYRQALRAGSAAESISTIAASYLRRLEQLSDAARVVDKMPPNFMHLGLIHMALPRARIIHMRRHPIDTCLSIYFQHFLSIHPYANDLSSLAHYYREYLRIMEHWRRVLPDGVLLEIPYESLVAGQESWSRRLLEFVGLPWDPRCLSFHETSRVVLTASKWQVRQKIHSSSSGRWRNYEKFVGPLRMLAPDKQL